MPSIFAAVSSIFNISQWVVSEFVIDASMGHVNLGKDTEIFVISVHLHLHTTKDRLVV